MKLIIFSIFTIFLWAFSASAQAPAVTKINNEAALRLEVENGKKLDLKSADLAKLPRREIRVRNQDDKETVYEGVEVREILQLADVKFGKEFDRVNLPRYLTVEAADNYRVVFAFAELDVAFNEKMILLVEKADGKLLPEKYGRWQIVVPDEKKRGRWVRQVVALKVKSAQ